MSEGDWVGVIDIPAKLSIDHLIKTLFPGLVAFAIFYHPIIYPLSCGFWITLDSEYLFIAGFLTGLFIGLVLMLCDLFIYRILMGIKYWPSPLWRWRFKKIQDYYFNLNKEICSLEDQEKTVKRKIMILVSQKNRIQKNENLEEKKRITEEINQKLKLEYMNLEKIYLDEGQIAEKIREFPPTSRKRIYPLFHSRNRMDRYPYQSPTRFGNLVLEYEDYSFNRYGIRKGIFWNLLFHSLSEETKKEFKLKDAIADMCVYLCFVILLYIFLGPLGFAIQKKGLIEISGYSIPLLSILCFLASVIAFILMYEITIAQHRSYGNFFKFIIDAHRKELTEKLGIKIEKRYHASPKDLENEQTIWNQYGEFFFDYGFVEKET